MQYYYINRMLASLYAVEVRICLYVHVYVSVCDGHSRDIVDGPRPWWNMGMGMEYWELSMCKLATYDIKSMVRKLASGMWAVLSVT